ncbi:MAG TPA: relaxase/mobilization nuclease domain-containing protein [Gemmatimonadaceae bacterium]|nr:relaxase/mobilization nuclease domain-containing protein [Gemmatimonadaceae bacterium]
MIAVSSSSRSFAALGKYLVVGRERVEQGRVAWTAARNIPTDEPELAAKIMRATASQNVRVAYPVYHLALSFDPHDHVNRAAMERVADHVLRELKLEEHQAIIVAHSDRAHPHMHILVNRVHPETGRVWDRWQDYPAIQRALREEERALGLRQVESHTNDPPERDSRSLDTTRPPEVASEQSTLQRSAGATRLEMVRADVDAYERVNELTRTRYAAERDLATAEARLNRVDAALDRLSRADLAFEEALSRAYRDPSAARAQFLAIAGEHGEREAARRMRESPILFGEMLGERRTASFMHRSPDVPTASLAAAREAAAFGTELVASHREIAKSVDSERVKGATEYPRSDRHEPATRDKLVGAVENARANVEAIRLAERALPSHSEIEMRLGQGLRRLSPPEFERLRSTLTLERLSLANKLRQMVRDAALGREEEV